MKRIIFLSFIFPSFFVLPVFGQEGISYDLKKPEKYENRTLGYEKTEQTKFKLPRHFIQNTVTHYNFYFNANNKINAVIARAKLSNRDDYSKLLSFYNYSLDVTARDRRELDSVVDKCMTAILIHDLRNDWVDNLYMLMGRAYFYHKTFDSAAIVFQFVNYAFSPRDRNGDLTPIGSNADIDEGRNALIVSTNEKRNILKKTFSLPPSRNESLIWLVRTQIATNQRVKAASLIEILKQDPQFPARLQPDLEECQALLFYNQEMYDSAAIHLEKALDNAGSNLERARWEYLIAQLYDLTGHHDLSVKFFEKVVQHTYDPVMEVYARLNAIRQRKGADLGKDYIQKNIHALLRMAHKEIYFDYRDIIYYTAAQIELEQKNRAEAIQYLLKSVHFAGPSSVQKTKSFLQLGDLAFEDKKYKLAKNFYDSVSLSKPGDIPDLNLFKDRKTALDKVVAQMLIIERRDSLEHIANMTPGDRTALLKKMLRQIRKQQGLNEEEEQGGQNFSFNGTNASSTDLFNTDANAEWYFYNSSLKSRGFNDFRSKWGNRPNVDNWSVAALSSKEKLNGNKTDAGQGVATDDIAKGQTAQLSMESLLSNLPLTPEKMKKSRDSLETAYFALGRAYQDGIPDYQAAISSYDSLLKNFPNTNKREETLFNLYYCYKKLGDNANAARILQLMHDLYPNGAQLNKIIHPTDSNDLKIKATKDYEQIYNSYIEGNFGKAIADKKKADSIYGEQFWTPQLLYIEAIYLVHQHEDSAAIAKLNFFNRRFSSSPMGPKGKTLLDVLLRRRQIEYYLDHLSVVRAKDDDDLADSTLSGTLTRPLVFYKGKGLQDSVVAKPKAKSADTAQVARKPTGVPAFASAFTYAPDQSHSVAVLLTKVDPVYVTETKNAFSRYNREYYYNKTLDITTIALGDTSRMVLISGFDSSAEAITYMDKARAMAPREIIPWLPATKYELEIISAQNLIILQQNKDLGNYKKFLINYYPAKFPK